MRVLRETIELPITNPELFRRVGIAAPKGVLLYGPPGTGKTLLARALACNVNANFMKVVASSIMDKYIGIVLKIKLISRGVCQINSGNVFLCQEPSTLHYFY